MSTFAFEIVARQIGFDSEDVRYIQELVPLIRSEVDEVVDHLYGRLLAEPRFGDSFSSDPARLDQLRDMFKDWLIDMLGGEYDECYWKNRSSFIRAHLQVDFAQQYITVGLEILRQELNRIIRQSGGPKVEAGIESFHKLLTIEAVAILESYKELYAAHVRRKERSMAEEQLTQSEHMAQLGQLAASLAHEIKNPLAGISGASEVIRDGLDPLDPRRHVIREIIGQINRLDAAVKDLLVYARPTAPELRSIDLAAQVEHTWQTIRDAPAFQTVHIEVVADGEVPPVRADIRQIEQLVMNLFFNAAHASSSGGHIQVTIRQAGDKVQLVVADRGHGMDESVKTQAFEPFFTTKAKGTGLGLAICRKIVEAHRGTIILESKRNVGTWVTVSFPAAGA